MNKLDKAYKSIGEVAEILNLKNSKKGNLNTHTIRFWEKTFKQVKPKIFNSKRRYYDKKNVDILKKIKYLLKDQIKGVKKILDNEKPLNLDDVLNKSINSDDKNLKFKLNKILNIIKELKNIK